GLQMNLRSSFIVFSGVLADDSRFFDSLFRGKFVLFGGWPSRNHADTDIISGFGFTQDFTVTSD
ncbi:MAG: hypothetical protein WC069_06780, partial [Candidatus Shapirobacteria bacterium]